MSTIPDSANVSQCIIHQDVKIGERCQIQKTIIGSNTMIDADITITLESTILGDVKKTDECLIIPSDSRITKHVNGTLICAAL